VELHTGAFCHVFDRRDRRRGPVELGRLIAAAEQAHGLGLQVNAGHGINLGNVDEILRVPHLHTLNIGHSLVARAVFAGLGAAVREMRGKMGAYRLGDAEKRTR
jgi:pyridoxine 5-phosphate synthase